MYPSLIAGESDPTGYIERTAERLRTMAANTTGLENADPLQVRARLEHRDRHARRKSLLNRSIA